MNPAARLSTALVVGLVLWFPTFSATMRGDAELHTAAVRYLLAFLFARVAVGFLARLIHNYTAPDDEDVAPMIESHADDAVAA